MYKSNVCLSCIKNICIQYTNYTLCVCVVVVVNWYFFTEKNLVYNSLDRTLILHAYDPTAINPVTNHSHPAWSDHVTCQTPEISLPVECIATTSSRDRLQIPPTLTPFDLQYFTGYMHFVSRLLPEVRWVAGVVLDQAYLPFPDLGLWMSLCRFICRLVRGVSA